MVEERYGEKVMLCRDMYCLRMAGLLLRKGATIFMRY